MSFKDIFICSSDGCSAERNHLCNFGREQFCLIYFEFGPMVQMSFKIFLIWSSGGPSVQWSGTIYAILKEGIMGTIDVKLYEIWTSGSGDVI